MIMELFEHNQTAYNTANDTLNLIGKYESIICKKQREKANSIGLPVDYLWGKNINKIGRELVIRIGRELVIRIGRELVIRIGTNI